MRFSQLIITGILMTGVQAIAEPTLPLWDLKERAELEATGWIPGATLLTDSPVPGEPEPPAAEPLQVEPPKPEEIADDLKPTLDIAEQFLPAYFAERPKSFLIDPQGLLSPADYRDRLSFLNYHANDSSIDLFVYVIGGEQDIPSEVREEEMIERFFTQGRPAALVYYYLGAPQRSVLYLSPTIAESISAAEQHRALESSVMQAVEKIRPSEQIEKFLVQMSIRIYWMERMLVPEPELATAAPSSAILPRVSKPVVLSAKFIWLQEHARKFAFHATLAGGFLLAILGLGFWRRVSARYRFPDFEVEPRLGGAHAAGIGAVISFASAAVPPASQRNQVPDYLRRA